MNRWVSVFLLALLTLPLPALDFAPLGQALKQALPATDQAYQTTLKIDADQSRQLAGGFRAGESFTVYYTKNAAGSVTGRAVELKEILVKYGVLHRWVIGLRPDGTLSAVVVTRLGDAHAFPVADKKFQAQFSGKGVAGLALGTTVDAMTGATESSQLLVDSIGRARSILGWADCR
jgi:hypothetical protein